MRSELVHGVVRPSSSRSCSAGQSDRNLLVSIQKLLIAFKGSWLWTPGQRKENASSLVIKMSVLP